MFKKLFVLLISATLAATAFAGCQTGGGGGGSTPSSSTPPSSSQQPVPSTPKVTYDTYQSFWMRQFNYKVMPVTAFNAIPHNYADYTHNYMLDENTYAAYAEAGVNTLMALYESTGISGFSTALDYCSKYGLAYLFPFSDGDAASIEKQLARFVYSDAFAGIMQYDEPGRVSFEAIKNTADAVNSVMPDDVTGILTHVNLFPNYASQKQLYYRASGPDVPKPEGGYTYEQYVSDYLSIVKPRILSYDYYPCFGDRGNLSNTYFDNMAVIRSAAAGAGIPFWVYIQTCKFSDTTRIPDEADILWQVNTALSYGAKGIQYFTGVCPVDGGTEAFSGSMFDKAGNRTEVYNYVKRANTQIKAVDEVLMCSLSKGVILTGGMPWGDHIGMYEEDILTSYGALASVEGAHIFTGCFDSDGRDVYYLTDNSTLEGDAATLNFSSAVSGYYVKNGNKTVFEGQKLTLEFDAGEGILVVLG